MSERNEELGIQIIEHFMDELADAPAARKHHNSFKGGLLDHLNNTLHFAKKHFPDDNRLHFMAIIHDVGKAREYGWEETEEGEFRIYRTWPNIDHILHTICMLHEYGIRLTHEELNALQMHHGGWSPFKRADLCELAVKLHFCDMMAVDLEVRGKATLDVT